MENDFLPDDYKIPSAANAFMKFEDEVNKFRFLDKPLTGTLFWQGEEGERKKLRFKTGEEIKIDKKFITDANKPKHFWAAPVWNYKTKSVQFLEIDKITIIREIFGLFRDPEWGSPRNYDIVVTKEGEKEKTKYSVRPSVPKPLTDEIKEAWEKVTIDYDAYLATGNPFGTEATEATDAIDGEINLDDIPFE